MNIEKDIKEEVKKAELNHPQFNSPHEGYAIIAEELDELWDEVKKKDEHGRYLTILYIVDNHKYGHWKPFKDSIPKEPISFNK